MDKNFTLTSSDLPAGQKIGMEFIYNDFACTGGNQSPALEWITPPASTKSLALTLFDMDAPTGSGFWHWQVIHLPVNLSSLPRNASAHLSDIAPHAIQMRNDYGNIGYGGPCPPVGVPPHHYVFTLYALSVEQLDLPNNASASLTGFMIHANEIARACLTRTYGR